MKKALLFGGSGQVGAEVTKRAADFGLLAIAPSSKEISLTDYQAVSSIIERERPSLIINCAAYTAVDLAEDESERAHEINGVAVGHLAKEAARCESRLIHLSTDYVFSGRLGRPLREEDAPAPQSAYGRSKLRGEQLVHEVGDSSSLIIRTSSVFGMGGGNFVKTMLRLLREREEVKVVADQVMSPTWAGWLAEVVLKLVEKDAKGLFHASCDGALSWYDFAMAIREEEAAILGEDLPRAEVKPITAEEFPVRAPRPPFSAFDLTHLRAALGGELMSWREGLRHFLREYLEPQRECGSE